MRRAIISIIIVLSLLSVASTSVNAPLLNSSPVNLDSTIMNDMLIADIMDSGSNVPIDQYVNRLFPNQVLTLSNSFSSLSTHKNSIDLSSYQIPGWTLYKVIIDTDNITAISEREVAGSSTSPSATTSFAIDEPGGVDVYINQLAQGFYNISHDGQLQNISLLYRSPSYDTVNNGYAYFDIRSDYQDGGTNMVSSVQLEDVGLTATWANVTESIVLYADNVYYAMINGTKLIDYSGSYPDIYWFYENDPGSFLTSRYSTEFSSWGSNSYEAILNYTYIPWNTISGSPIVYSNPSTINTAINSSYVAGNSWIINSVNNITSLDITTDQSVDIFYNLTLCYTNDNVGNTQWGAAISGNPIMWNVTTDLTFPAVPNVVSRAMDITTIPTDWNTTGLYLGAVPGGSDSKTGTTVECTGLSDGTWTLTSTAPNYIVDLAISDSSDSSPITTKVANNVTMAIETTLITPITGGPANLSILKSGSLVYSPAEINATAGSADFLWDIDATTIGNGTHSIEVFWTSTNGLEAGYYTHDIFVYHSTTLVADDISIVAFTESTFNIGIDFDEIYPARGLDEIPANVTYSFGSVVNDSMSNPSGGRWTQIVNTTSMSNGFHNLTVYAEGFALENQTLNITVFLNHQTQVLNSSWSNSDNITYTEYTKLSISYVNFDGLTRIANATVNVTIEGVPYNMTWDPSNETYWIELTGENFTGQGTFALDVVAWKAGFEAQNDTINITIRIETTGLVFTVDYIPNNLTISYIESLFIQVTYNFNSVPIDENTVVRVLFNGSASVTLDYNATSEKWEFTLLGSNYLGAWDIIVRATADGYSTRDNSTVFIVYEDTPTLSSTWSGDIDTTDYVTNVTLLITVEDSSGTLINGANLVASEFSSPLQVVNSGVGVYTITFNPQDIRGFHVINVTLAETGYAVTSVFINLTVRATTVIDVVYISEEYEQWNLNVTVWYNDTVYSTPIDDGTVTVTIDSVEFTLTYDSGVYIAIILLDFDPRTYNMTVVANAPFCNEASDTPTLDILAKSAVYLSVMTEGDPSLEGQRLEIIATLTLNESQTAVQGADIRFIVTVYYVNGTVEIRDDDSQHDTTNTEGVASWGFDIPSGNIDRIVILAEYDGNRINWETSLIHELSAGTNPLMLVLSFFFLEPVGQMLVLSIVILGIVATGYNKRIKPKKRAARASLENQLKMFRDLESLRHFMAVYLDRGTCVFYHPFTDERIQPDLISGFIAAITSVYGEIKGDGVRGTLEEIQYHGLRLNSYSGEFTIGILILEGEMTPLLKERLQFFVELFENQYDSELTDWNGLIDCFDSEWIVSTLTSAFNYSWLFAHKFGPTQKVGKTDARILDYISAVRDDRSEFHFRDLLAPLAEMLDITEAEVLDRLLALQDKGVIHPVSIQTILQRQGMGLANGEIGAGTQLELPEKEEPKVDEPELLAEEPPSEPVEESTPAEEPDKVEELVYDDDSLVEEKKEELDPMDAFVKDVESILTKEKEDESEES